MATKTFFLKQKCLSITIQPEFTKYFGLLSYLSKVNNFINSSDKYIYKHHGQPDNKGFLRAKQYFIYYSYARHVVSLSWISDQGWV